jgi:hypothetical protein
MLQVAAFHTRELRPKKPAWPWPAGGTGWFLKKEKGRGLHLALENLRGEII